MDAQHETIVSINKYPHFPRTFSVVELVLYTKDLKNLLLILKINLFWNVHRNLVGNKANNKLNVIGGKITRITSIFS